MPKIKITFVSPKNLSLQPQILTFKKNKWNWIDGPRCDTWNLRLSSHCNGKTHTITPPLFLLLSPPLQFGTKLSQKLFTLKKRKIFVLSNFQNQGDKKKDHYRFFHKKLSPSIFFFRKYFNVFVLTNFCHFFIFNKNTKLLLQQKKSVCFERGWIS